MKLPGVPDDFKLPEDPGELLAWMKNFVQKRAHMKRVHCVPLGCLMLAACGAPLTPTERAADDEIRAALMNCFSGTPVEQGALKEVVLTLNGRTATFPSAVEASQLLAPKLLDGDSPVLTKRGGGSNWGRKIVGSLRGTTAKCTRAFAVVEDGSTKGLYEVDFMPLGVRDHLLLYFYDPKHEITAALQADKADVKQQ